jgi:hypothetical protein
MHALVRNDQPRSRECAIQRMLQIVIDGVAAVVARKLATEQPLEITERNFQSFGGEGRPDGTKQILYGTTHSIRRADLHGVGDVVIAAPVLHDYFIDEALMSVMITGSLNSCAAAVTTGKSPNVSAPTCRIGLEQATASATLM